MRRTGVRSWTLFVAGSLIAGGLLSACGGGSSSADAPSSTGAATNAVADAAGTNTLQQSSNNSSSSTPGTVALSWLPPTDYTDGTAISNLAGYDIHYGTQSQNYTSSIKVSNPGLSNYTVEGLSPGTYYFAVSAYDADGAESDDSGEVAVQVN